MTKSKILTLAFTATILTLLILSGPVQGFNLTLSTNRNHQEKGDPLTFTAEIEIQDNENIPIKRIVLELSGPETQTCVFSPSGEILDDCENIKISLISSPAYGYGYGYGYGFSSGTLKYKIEIDTSSLKLGTYSSKIKAIIDGETFTKSGENIRIKQDKSDNEGICQKEWTCTSWSTCSNNIQYRECQRNLNYCYPEEKPAESRTCLLEDGNNFLEEESITLNTLEQEKIEPRISNAVKLQIPEGLQFVIILLLMNCIITLTNIIVKIQENHISLRTKSKKRPF